MLAEYERLLSNEPGRWVSELAGAEVARLEHGEVRCDLWVVGADELGGLALWDFVPGVGRRVRVYLGPAHRSAPGLGGLLDELDARSEHDGPVASVVDFIPGVPDPAQEAAFAPRGFFRVERLAFQRPADEPFPDADLFDRPDLRPLDWPDEEALAELVRDAYGPPNDVAGPWFMYRDPRQDARDAVHEILEGRRGAWLPWASFAVEVGGRVRGASLVTEVGGPVLTEVMVAPPIRGIGLGYHLALESIRVLRERGLGEVHAVTSSRDLRSLRLLARLGFAPVDERAPGLWVHRAAVAPSAPAFH